MHIKRRPAEADVDWASVADAFCAAWTSATGRPDFEALSSMYADDDVVIYDALPPLSGFTSFAEMASAIYPGLSSILVRRLDAVAARSIGGGSATVVSFPLRYELTSRHHAPLAFDGRISQVWERRGDRWVIVHEHPSTVIAA